MDKTFLFLEGEQTRDGLRTACVVEGRGETERRFGGEAICVLLLACT